MKHTLGQEKNKLGEEQDYPGIKASVLVSLEDAIRDHYLYYLKCNRFRNRRINYIELLKQLLIDKLADRRGAAKVRELVKEGSPTRKKRLAKSDVRQQAMLNLLEEASLKRLASIINSQNDSKMGLTIQRIEKLEIFKGNTEAIGSLYEVFFANKKKANYFLDLPTYIISQQVRKEFGGTIILDQYWNDREEGRVTRKRNMNQTAVRKKRARR